MLDPLRELVDRAPSLAGGAIAMAGNALGDWASLRHGVSGNDLDAWDPRYIRRTLPLMSGAFGGYFRGEVRGLERIPASGPVLLVGNHSGGIADTFVFTILG